jgi:hypothetical protein
MVDLRFAICQATLYEANENITNTTSCTYRYSILLIVNSTLALCSRALIEFITNHLLTFFIVPNSLLTARLEHLTADQKTPQIAHQPWWLSLQTPPNPYWILVSVPTGPNSGGS